MLTYVLQHFTNLASRLCMLKWQIPFRSLDKYGLEKDSQWSIAFSLLVGYWAFFSHSYWNFK